MEQSKPARAAVADFIEQAPFGAAMAPILAPQAQHFWETQESILSEAEAFSRHWFERRHRATRTALEAAKNVTQSGAIDPDAVMQTIADWQTHSIQRVVEDFQEWIAFCSRCATHVASQEMRSVEDVLEKASETAGSSARSKQQRPGLGTKQP